LSETGFTEAFEMNQFFINRQLADCGPLRSLRLKISISAYLLCRRFDFKILILNSSSPQSPPSVASHTSAF